MTSGHSELPIPSADLVIGAVGHRFLVSERAPLLNVITRSMRVLLEQAGSSDRISLVVSVAEGADRLFIEAAKSLGIPYTCVLPCSASCFEEDFQGEKSISQFRGLVSGAADVVQPEADAVNRDDGYLWASRYIVEHADVLLAVWDGMQGNGPAGTGDTVRHAEARSIPVIWIPSQAPHVPIELATASSDLR